jgi:hypothetical protein
MIAIAMSIGCARFHGQSCFSISEMAAFINKIAGVESLLKNKAKLNTAVLDNFVPKCSKENHQGRQGRQKPGYVDCGASGFRKKVLTIFRDIC